MATLSANTVNHHSSALHIINSYFAYSYSTKAHPLDKIFKPKTVAVVGATEKKGSVGRNVLWNLVRSPFGGTVFPVNLNRKNVMGILAYPSISAIPEKVDLAIICIQAQFVPNVIKECVKCGVGAAVIISAGFAEAGEQGKEWFREIQKTAKEGNLKIIGPNCLGVMSPKIGFNGSFSAGISPAGTVGVISQSGALGTAIVDWAIKENVGFSRFASIGSMVDVGWSDLLEYYGRDPETKSIVLYMEGIGDARSFMSSARNVALKKPIVVIKAGSTEEGKTATASHTGSLAGSDEVIDTVFKRCGVLRVQTIQELFLTAEVLAKQPRPKGKRLCIITNAGGPSCIATDALVRNGGELAKLSKETIEKLDKVLPPHWSRGNPVDVLGDANATLYTKALQICAEDSQVDGILVILTPQSMSEPTKTAEAIKAFATNFSEKPILSSWMGGNQVENGRKVLSKANLPSFEYPDTAAKIFNYMWQYSKNLDDLYKIPSPVVSFSDIPIERRNKANTLLKTVRESGRKLLTEYESKELLRMYNIPTTQMIIAKDAEESVKAAEKLGYPVVLKINSETVTHKADVGGVFLNLKTADEVRKAFEHIQKNVKEEDFLGASIQPMICMNDSYELILGSNADPQCGPVMLFGSGGSLVEIYNDTSLALPPITSAHAHQMINATKISKALKGFRNKSAVDLDALAQVMVRFSYMVTELSHIIKEIEMNPILVSGKQIIALDARVVLYSSETKNIPKPAIRPYPSEYVSENIMKDNSVVIVRPCQLEDHSKLLQFFVNFSRETSETEESGIVNAIAYILQNTNKLSSDKLSTVGKEIINTLTRLCMGDYDNELAFVAEAKGNNEILGICLTTRSWYSTNTASVAIVVSSKCQRKGIGTLLLEKAIEIAKKEGINELQARFAKGTPGVKLFQKMGFQATSTSDLFVKKL